MFSTKLLVTLQTVMIFVLLLNFLIFWDIPVCSSRGLGYSVETACSSLGSTPKQTIGGGGKERCNQPGDECQLSDKQPISRKDSRGSQHAGLSQPSTTNMAQPASARLLLNKG